MNTETGNRVTVTGAAGFIGRYVVDELLRRGWRVRAFVHRDETIPFFPHPALDVDRGDVRDADSLLRVVAGAAAVVSLAAVKSDEPESEAVNVGGARNLVQACHLAGCRRVINISTQSAKIARKGLYGRTKLAADELFAASGLDVTTLRPSLVYGPGRSGAFATVQRFVETLPLVPVLGDGRWISAPLHVRDVARAIAACLETPVTIGRCYDLGGPDLIAFDALIDRIATASGQPRCRKVHLPLGLSLACVRTIRTLWPGAPFTVSNVLGSNQDTAIDLGSAERDFAFRAMPLSEGFRLLVDAERGAALEAEGRRFGRHLLGQEPAVELCLRYAMAARELFGGELDGDTCFVREHPWALGVLDAATAALRPRSQLRRRLLLMAAILEASPLHADFFLRPPPRVCPLVLGLAFRGTCAVVKLAAGLLILPFLPRAHVQRE